MSVLKVTGNYIQMKKIRSVSVLDHEVAFLRGENKEDIVYQVTNTYTGKSFLGLNRLFMQWIYTACERSLKLGLIGARA